MVASVLYYNSTQNNTRLLSLVLEVGIEPTTYATSGRRTTAVLFEH
jgi:hypothetical protein